MTGTPLSRRYVVKRIVTESSSALTLREIADVVGLTRERVRQLIVSLGLTDLVKMRRRERAAEHFRRISERRAEKLIAKQTQTAARRLELLVKILPLRESGMTMWAIGDALGIGGTYVSHVLIRAGFRSLPLVPRSLKTAPPKQIRVHGPLNPTPPGVADWTILENICTLRRLWDEGHSAAEIGRRMNISKNAVIGKAHRLGLPARESPIIRGVARKPFVPAPIA